MPGPLPEPKRRRTNAPTIPTTALPAAGRSGPAPRPPKWVKLGPTAAAWWRWAWRTPQAAGWAAGHESFVARRAALEDDLAALDQLHSLDALELLDQPSTEAVRFLVTRLASLATGRLGIYREMREIDDRLGLTPKGMAALRWAIVAPVEAPAEDAPPVSSLEDRRRRLSSAS